MKTEMILVNGVKVEVVKDGLNLTFTDGTVIKSDSKGKICGVEEPNNQKYKSCLSQYASREETDFDMIASGMENGLDVIGTDGGVIRFDDNGRQLHESVFNKAESFMEYFDFMGHEQQKIAKEWYAVNKDGKIKRYVKYRKISRMFFTLLDMAVKNVSEEYYIANLEPSIDKNGKIYYKKGEEVTRGFSFNNWRQKARDFAPEYESDLATDCQLVLWYAYRIAMGYWTIEYVCCDSSSEGNYRDSPDEIGKIEVSGTRKVGGACDGVGNTRKLVLYWWPNQFSLFGGCYGELGSERPVGSWESFVYPNNPLINSTGVVALNKVRDNSH